ncbi:histidine kinase dimerization/phospho-acceptor domain-containing protein [Leptolyngbya sp. FACHB-261]|uniref:histidine kinase dimerization/phospho-acceptor domain-containing protein n=1 Tax=Leptolyngbya sp. FACHB-261 TaxID=2692806 RepID=UPI0028C50C3A|nr:histidine kinase dimerization/phospho-acceptor domain-containing protein [Leptolyngbya sp. FACHB-261]
MERRRGLSYLVASRIVRPLTDLEQVTQQFAEGSFQARAPRNGVPELDHLSQSFNHMAASLEGVEQRRRELISDLTHELRTPLTVLEGSLEGLADGVIEPSPVVYERLARESARLRRLVNDLQELSQAEAGYLKINLQPLELRPLLDNLIARFRNQIPEGGPELYLKVPVNLPSALVDPDRLEQCWSIF